MVKVLVLIFVIPCLASCGGESRGPVVYYRAGEGGAVAMAGARTIYASQLVEACRESGLKPAPALEKLIDEYLLIHEAVGEGLLDDEAVIRDWKKALVQKLLEEQVEKKVPEDSVTSEDIKRYYVKNYENKGKLLEEAWEEIRFKILTERRNAFFEKLVRSLEEEGKPVIHDEKLDRLK